MQEQLILEFPWPSSAHPEELCRVVVRDYKGQPALEIYPQYDGDDGKVVRGKGVVFRPQEAEQLRSALDSALPLLGVSGPRRLTNLEEAGEAVSARPQPGVSVGGGQDIITNAMQLTRARVKHKRVLCPLCRNKVFEKWPEGWDGHAGHRCAAVEGTVEERKASYRAQVAHLMGAPDRRTGRNEPAPARQTTFQALGRALFDGRPAQILQMDVTGSPPREVYSVRFDGEAVRREVICPPSEIKQIVLFHGVDV